MSITLEIRGVNSKETNRRLVMKNNELLMIIEKRILKESCALVYLIMPA